MSHCPPELRYADSHEWARLEDSGQVTVGITDHAQEALGDVVYIELPDVGQVLKQGEVTGVVESVKAASDLYAPVSGKVVAVNEALAEAPEQINDSPYGEGWMYRIEPADAGQLDQLLSASAYLASCEDS